MNFQFSKPIKLTSSPAPEDVARLEEAGRMLKSTRQVFVCRVRNSITTGPRWVTNLADYLQALDGR